MHKMWKFVIQIFSLLQVGKLIVGNNLANESNDGLTFELKSANKKCDFFCQRSFYSNLTNCWQYLSITWVSDSLIKS